MSESDLERLLDYDGRRYWLANGWSILFSVKRVPASERRPHGLGYSFTLHDEAGERILGFDNARHATKVVAQDHYHPLRRTEIHREYTFVDANTLLTDFFRSVEEACNAEGVPFVFDEDETDIV